jgi:hypothetical protein
MGHAEFDDKRRANSSVVTGEEVPAVIVIFAWCEP